MATEAIVQHRTFLRSLKAVSRQTTPLVGVNQMITNSVFVLSKNGKILEPTTPVRARILQSQDEDIEKVIGDAPEATVHKVGTFT